MVILLRYCDLLRFGEEQPMKRETISLKKPSDPTKIALSESLGLRFIDKRGRYIMQARVGILNADLAETTWVDIPLVPETYGP